MFFQSRMKGAMISGMEVDKASHTLYTADSYGFVFVWNIKDYCLNYCHEDPPECTYSSVQSYHI